MKHCWKNSREYKRILEILHDYWLTEPEEDKAIVSMEFYKGKERQSKQISWVNPKNKKWNKNDPIKLISAQELLEMSFVEISYKPEKGMYPIAFYHTDHNCCCDSEWFILQKCHYENEWIYSCVCSCGLDCTNGYSDEQSAIQEYRSMCDEAKKRREGGRK